ncbi:MAG: hypothetical protein ABSB15_04085 [Bryobacteraceae bacterium]|jgi:hypothetical protein
MSVSPVSNVTPLHQTQPIQSQPPKAASQPASDTVHLSPAATAQAKGGNINHDRE